MSKQLISKNTFLFKNGSTPLAENVITTANDVLVSPKAKMIDYKDCGNGQVANDKTVVNADFVTADFSVDVIARASGAAGTAPKIAELFKACGLKETVVASSSVAYTPEIQANNGSGIVYLDGEKRTISGAAASFSFSGKIGDFAKFSFGIKGFTTLAPAAEQAPTVTLDTNDKLIVLSATVFTVGGDEIDLEDFEFDLGADIQESYYTNTKDYTITNFKPTLKVSAVKTKGNADYWAELNSNAQKAVVITLGSGSGKVLEFKANYCQPTEADEKDQNGFVVYSRNWNCENSAGGDNFSLTYK